MQLIFAAASLETLIRSSLVSVKDFIWYRILGAQKSHQYIFYKSHRFSKWRLDFFFFSMKSLKRLNKARWLECSYDCRFSRSWEDLWANSSLQISSSNTLVDTKNLWLKIQLNKVLDMIFQHLKKIILTIIMIDKFLEILSFYFLSICSSES